LLWCSANTWDGEDDDGDDEGGESEGKNDGDGEGGEGEGDYDGDADNNFNSLSTIPLRDSCLNSRRHGCLLHRYYFHYYDFNNLVDHMAGHSLPLRSVC
jgi:hypothetical protein